MVVSLADGDVIAMMTHSSPFCLKQVCAGRNARCDNLPHDRQCYSCDDGTAADVLILCRVHKNEPPKGYGRQFPRNCPQRFRCHKCLERLEVCLCGRMECNIDFLLLHESYSDEEDKKILLDVMGTWLHNVIACGGT